MAAPAGASVLEPVTAAYNSSGTEVQTVNATVQQPSDPRRTYQLAALRRDGSRPSRSSPLSPARRWRIVATASTSATQRLADCSWPSRCCSARAQSTARPARSRGAPFHWGPSAQRRAGLIPALPPPPRLGRNRPGAQRLRAGLGAGSVLRVPGLEARQAVVGEDLPPGLRAHEAVVLGADRGSSSSAPSRTDTSGPSGQVPPKRLEPQRSQNAFDIPPSGRYTLIDPAPASRRKPSRGTRPCAIAAPPDALRQREQWQ